MSSNIASAATSAAATNPTRTFPLTRFAGARPASPGWFDDAISTPHADKVIDVEGAAIRTRAWGDAGKPGLLLVHGGLAHLGWWDFIAPLLADRFHIVAPSLSGMGGSDFRDAYSVAQHGREALAAASAWGQFDGGRRPVLIGHSFGGFVTLLQAAEAGERLAGAVIMDTPIRPPGKDRSAPTMRGARHYESMAEALARFRLLPDQDCDNLFLVDHVARGAIQRFDDEAGVSRYRWAHDPALWKKLQRIDGDPTGLVGRLKCPMALMRGAQSALVTDEVWKLMGAAFGPHVPQIDVPQARHHLMLDQPLATVAALRALLSVWPQ